MEGSGKLICVITSIQEPTPAVHQLTSVLMTHGAHLIVVGDWKGPRQYACPGSRLVGLSEQLALPYGLAELLPENHYVRKNLGYLVAIDAGASCLFETDDDNAPLPRWAPRSLEVRAERVEPRLWANVYRLFDRREAIWPRGFPLNLVCDETTFAHDASRAAEVIAPVQQSLVNGSPDVDAVWRLVGDRPHDFPKRMSLWLPPGTWCPFNSQATWWWPIAYPLLYLPSFCSFRMTDIWRSFVAQRCLWAMGYGVVFHSPEMHQDRNTHDLMRDFEDEIPGYLGNVRLSELLGPLELSERPEDAGVNLRRCYEELVRESFLPSKELKLVDAWLADIEALEATRQDSSRV